MAPSVGDKPSRNKTRRREGHQHQIVNHQPLQHHPLKVSQNNRKLKPELTQFLHSKVSLPPFRKTVLPGHNFYQYVNGQWLRSTPIPPYSSSYGVSEEVESYIQGFLLREIIACQRIAEAGKEARTDEEKIYDAIGRLAMSALRPEKQKHSLDYLKRGIRSLGCMRNEEDLGRIFGYMCRFHVKTIIKLTVVPEKKDSYQLNISPGSFGLPDKSYYSASAPGKSNILYAYTNLIRQTTKKLDFDDFAQVIPLEAKLIGALEYINTKDDVDVMTLKDLQTRFKHIAWTSLLESYGIPKEKMGHISYHIDSVGWLKYVNEQIQETPFENWYSLFALHTLLHALPYLPPPFDDWHFDFFGRMLRGQRKKTPQDILTLNIAKKQMRSSLGYVFVKKYLSPEFKAQSTHFVKKIIHAAMKRMPEVEWLSPETRKKAAEKLRRMGVGAAYSEPLMRNPPSVPFLQTDNLLANLYLLEAAETDRHIEYLTNHAPKGLWDETPYSVNAYYFNDTNEIIIPAGSFFWPFFNQNHKEWVGWNFGGLGAVIGHEITHAFDQEGKEFSPSGELETWWTAEDNKNYTERTRDLIRVFGQAKILGRSINGAATLNENLADLGGLAIALDALKRELHGVSEEEQKKQLRDFFISYAVSWRTKEQHERSLQRLILDKHAPPELRVNLIVSQFDEWYDTFQIRTEDTLYIPPEERIRIF